ncbi:hypothetical protein BaRGS_00036333, partial [Batillaria attramentaria]
LYRLEHTFDRNDSLPTEWEWSADGYRAEEKRIRFDVLCLQVIRQNGTTTKSSGFTYLKVVVRAHTADIEKCKLMRRDSEILRVKIRALQVYPASAQPQERIRMNKKAPKLAGWRWWLPVSPLLSLLSLCCLQRVISVERSQ